LPEDEVEKRMVRLIDADALYMNLLKMKDFGELTAKKAIRAVQNEPTMDVEPKWIPCSEKMPEEREWIGTKDFGTTISDEVYVTFESPKGERFCKHLSFQNGKISRYDQMKIDTFHKGAIPIAWMQLPKPYEVKDDKLN